MNEAELKSRTKQFALRAIRLVDALPRKVSAEVLGKQLIRSASSVGANYRSACRAKSSPDFISKLSIVEEEADESEYWLELIQEAELMKHTLVDPLRTEAHEITAIFTASIKTARRNTQSTRSNPKSKI
ncbi:MAG: four helix bundle protein [Verrucomicrobiaceae bacterium]|nr:four helix bundle protein [Verrucomicrobiaceae bacterium]